MSLTGSYTEDGPYFQFLLGIKGARAIQPLNNRRQVLARIVRFFLIFRGYDQNQLSISSEPWRLKNSYKQPGFLLIIPNTHFTRSRAESVKHASPCPGTRTWTLTTTFR